MVSSFPEEMGSMQRQLSTYKEAASDIHYLRAEVQSLSAVLDRKVGALWCVCAFRFLSSVEGLKALFSGAGKRV